MTGGPSDGDASIFFFDIDYMQLHHSNMHLVILMEIEFVFLYVLYSRCFYVCMKQACISHEKGSVKVQKLISTSTYHILMSYRRSNVFRVCQQNSDESGP